MSSIKLFLLSKDIAVDAFATGKEARTAIKKNSYDMYILDLNVPEMSGIDILKHIRKKDKYTPVIVITGSVDINSIDEAYSLGCSEYLKKPFNLRELEIRMDKLKKASDDLTVRITRDYEFDIKKELLLYKGDIHKLTRNQNKLIRTLVENIGGIVSFEDLKLLVWDDYNISDITIRSLITRIRDTIKEDFIQTFRGIGYRIAKYPPAV
jgi:DNA-binding response OmpR family regulator